MDKILVFDTETTGFDEPQPVEVAYLVVNEAFDVVDDYCERFKPSKAISYGAMATHHIVASDLVNCTSYSTFSLPSDTRVLIGHKVDFDWEVIGKPETNAQGRPIRRICTLALARKLLPDVDSHTQGALMYYFFGEGARVRVKDAHSALSDVHMCLDILKKLLEIMPVTSIEDLWRKSEEARIPDKITFGKHDGMLVKDLPRDYCSWLLKQDWLDPYMRIAINKRT